MMRASVLVAVLAVAICGAQGSIQIEECTDAKFNGPLERTFPISYNVFMSINNINQPIFDQVVTLGVEIGDTSLLGIAPEPTDTLVLYKDPSVKLDSLTVVKSWEPLGFVKLRFDVKSMCQISEKQLLVIKFKEEMPEGFKIDLIMVATAQIRNDNKGVHKVGDSVKVDFSNAGIRYMFPCFDSPSDDQSNVNIGVNTITDYVVSSETLPIQWQGKIMGDKVAKFKSTGPIDICTINFEIKPEKKN